MIRANVRILLDQLPWEALGPVPCGEGVADPSKRCILHICVNTPNLVVLRQRVHAEIEGNPQTWVPLWSCPPCGGGVADYPEIRPSPRVLSCRILPFCVNRYERY